MKKALLILALLGTTGIMAAAGEKASTQDIGSASAMVKAMYVLYDKENGYAPNNGSGYLLQLKYESPDLYFDNLKAGFGVYVNGDTGLTDWDDPDKKQARGMFVSAQGEEKANLGQAYLAYKAKGLFKVKLGRQEIRQTPMTTIKPSLMPNFYEAYGITSDVWSDLTLHLMQITRISYGSRAATDWGLISENTGTGGAPHVVEEKGGVGQARFIAIGDVAGEESSAGFTVLGARYKGVKNLTLSLWNYCGHKIVNDLYGQVDYILPLSTSPRIKLSAQYLNQQSISGFESPYTKASVDFWMAGAKATVWGKRWVAFAAYNHSSDSDQMYNVYGSDPGFTSTLFSRNEYRKGVQAYKLGGSYKIIKGVVIVAGYGYYGKSDTINAKGWEPTSDAQELDVFLNYKPTKSWKFTLCTAWRNSEYDNYGGADRSQKHVRLIGLYKF